ncbi:hypothetical protein TNCV_208641 [Trichonephila clavipes]|uniref:Uncharacterized protein n=1 Tax=Trichonephila clavipes TaxID=2585209 RepID=A0A8X6T2Y6_TRICX|nr:hypothetical protein TNCV_208641 [Trichonephila clavipes]
MRVYKYWTDEYRKTRKLGSGRREVTSARNDQHLLRMVVNDHTASSRQMGVLQLMQLHPWPAYSSDISPIEHVGELVVRLLARDPLQKTNFCCAYKQFGILFHKQTFKICLTPCYVLLHCLVATPSTDFSLLRLL